MNIQDIQAHHASRIHALLLAAPEGLTANALSRAAGLEEVEVYSILVWLYDRDMARPEITWHLGQSHVASWTAMCSAETFHKLKPQVVTSLGAMQ
jgi:chromosome segregation and condensation protein ScpB